MAAYLPVCRAEPVLKTPQLAARPVQRERHKIAGSEIIRQHCVRDGDHEQPTRARDFDLFAIADTSRSNFVAMGEILTQAISNEARRRRLEQPCVTDYLRYDQIVFGEHVILRHRTCGSQLQGRGGAPVCDEYDAEDKDDRVDQKPEHGDAVSLQVLHCYVEGFSLRFASSAYASRCVSTCPF
jgi:hypothetical protein